MRRRMRRNNQGVRRGVESDYICIWVITQIRIEAMNGLTLDVPIGSCDGVRGHEMLITATAAAAANDIR
jgi:hypothetical protein